MQCNVIYATGSQCFIYDSTFLSEFRMLCMSLFSESLLWMQELWETYGNN